MHRTAAHLIGVLAFAAVAVAVPLSAQQPQQLRPGQRVRVSPVRPDSTPFVGELLALADSSLTVRRDSADVRRFAFRDIRRIEVSQGRRSNARTGATAGEVAGLVAGLAYGLSTPLRLGSCRHGFLSFCFVADAGSVLLSTGYILFTTALGTAAGGVLGAGIGLFVKTEAWQVVSAEHPPVGVLSLRHDRVIVGLSLAF